MVRAIRSSFVEKILEEAYDWCVFDKVIFDRGEDHSYTGYVVLGGECENDGVTMFRVFIINKNTRDTYRTAMNSSACDKERRAWMLDVLISHYMQLIQSAQKNQIKHTKEAFSNFMSVAGLDKND